MTMYAVRDESRTDHIRVVTTYGPITNEVSEPYTYLKSLWSDLGRIIEAIEKETRNDG